MTDLNATDLEPAIKVLRAKARDRLPDDVVTDTDQYDKTDDDGDKIRERTVRGPGGTSTTVDENLSVMYRPSPSTTGDVEILVLEAELQADGADLGNPHIPATVETRDEALDRIESAGLEPAWNQ